MRRFPYYLNMLLLIALWPIPRLLAQERLEMRLETTFVPEGTAQLIKYTVMLPPEVPGRQEDINMSASHAPHRVFTRDGQPYAEFRFSRVKEPVSLQLHLSMEVYPYDLRRITSPVEPLNYPGTWLQPEPFLEVEAPEIQTLARQLAGADVWASVRKSYQAVRDSLTYDPQQQGALGALTALRDGRGDCTEYADLLTALLRAQGIPARTVNGWVFGVTEGNPNHHWTEVWLVEYGWVPLDPTLGMPLPERPDRLIPHPNARYVRLSSQRVDPLCGSSTNHWKAWGKVEASYRYSHRLRPLLQARQK